MNKMKFVKLILTKLFILLKLTSVNAEVTTDQWALFNQKAEALYEEGDYDQALEFAKQALSLAEKSTPEDSARVIESLNQLGLIYEEQMEVDLAIQTWQHSLEIQEKIQGSEPEKYSRDYAKTLHQLAINYGYKRDFRKAGELYQQAVEVLENRLGKDHPDVAEELFSLGTLYKFENDNKAIPYFSRALKIWEQNGENEYQGNIYKVVGNLAEIYQKKGDFLNAEKFQERLLEMSEKEFGSDSPHLKWTLEQLAEIYQALERTEKLEKIETRLENLKTAK